MDAEGQHVEPAHFEERRPYLCLQLSLQWRCKSGDKISWNDGDHDARLRYRKIYFVLGIVFSVFLGLSWACYGLTQNFSKGTANYAGALIAMASLMTTEFIHCFMIARYVMVACYDKQKGCCSFYYTVWWQSFFPIIIIASTIAVIVCSIIFGIRYEDRVAEKDQVNKDANYIMGIINLVLAIVINIVASVALYYGRVLKKDLDQAADNQGPFADIALDAQKPQLANYGTH